MGFKEIIGHERPVRLLKVMLRAGRLPHALLFTGPAGVGKRTLALALAQAANCLGEDPAEPCGVCVSCRKIARGVHPDVAELEPEGAGRVIKIKHVRDLRRDIAFKPFEGRTKVFIIREADRLQAGQEESANALLKTLEEPPPQSLLVLTAPRESELLPTIVSRCLRLNLAPLSRETIEAWLGRERGLAGPRARLLASLSGGCLGRVRDLDPDQVWAWRAEIAEIFGGEKRRPPGPAMEWAVKTAALKENRTEILDLLRFWCRDLMVVAAGGEARQLVNEDLGSRLQSLGAGRPAGVFISALQEIDQAEDAVNRFINADLVFENLMLALTGISEG
ncbi:MAG: DNA polymerase III subunit delta' [Pseudomonadota bacterium]